MPIHMTRLFLPALCRTLKASTASGTQVGLCIVQFGYQVKARSIEISIAVTQYERTKTYSLMDAVVSSALFGMLPLADTWGTMGIDPTGVPVESGGRPFNVFKSQSAVPGTGGAVDCGGSSCDNAAGCDGAG